MTEKLSQRLRRHAHGLMNGGTNASELRDDLNASADLLAAPPTPQEAQTMTQAKLPPGYYDPKDYTMVHNWHLKDLRDEIARLTQDLDTLHGAIETRKRLERRGEVPPLVTEGYNPRPPKEPK